MVKPVKFLSGVALSLCLVWPMAAASAPDAKTVVAVVNGTEITLGHMILVREGLTEQYKALPDDLLFSGILDQLVQQTMLSQSLEGDTPARIALALENEERTLRSAAVIGEVLADATTEGAIRAAYDTQYGGTMDEREYKAAHILVETIEEAEDLITQLEEGANFAKLAREFSTGPSGPNGGDLGWFGAGSMVKPFEDAVVGMQAGDISAPVKTRFGWHVIALDEVRVKEAPTIEAVRDELVDKIQEQVIRDHIDALLASGDITRPGDGTIDPALLKNTDLLED